MRIQLTDAEQADGKMCPVNLDSAIRLLREIGAVILEKVVPLDIGYTRIFPHASERLRIPQEIKQHWSKAAKKLLRTG